MTFIDLQKLLFGFRNKTVKLGKGYSTHVYWHGDICNIERNGRVSFQLRYVNNRIELYLNQDYLESKPRKVYDMSENIELLSEFVPIEVLYIIKGYKNHSFLETKTS